MHILGIETSCDETAAAVVDDGDRLLSNIVASQLATHYRYGGVVPEIASREHLRAIVPVVRQALAEAGLTYRDLDAVAVTQGPGLVGSLLVGLTFAKGLTLSLGIPLIAVNHIEGHIHAVFLEEKQRGGEIELPALALVVSGGHSHLFLVESPAGDEGLCRYRLLGKTRDDAAGEAFDKVARLLGFGYPGGPLIDKLAPYGDPSRVDLPRSRMKGNPLDLSFSGLKTAILRYVRASDMEEEINIRKRLFVEGRPATLEPILAVTPQRTRDLLAAFQATVIEELMRRARQAAEGVDVRSLIVAGGVAANSGLRKGFAASRLPVYFPTLGLSTDNAAMIAAAAFPRLQQRQFAPDTITAKPSLVLA
jgi:N6-L-threonylcarbamoyladenine synthase